MSRPLEHDYIGLTEISSSMEEISVKHNQSLSCSALKTELSLGLPGCESPERKHVCGVTIFGKDFEEKSVKGCASGAKRGFSDANLSKDGCLLYSSSLKSGPTGKNLSGVDNNNNNNNNNNNHCSSPKPVLKQQPQVSAASEHGSAPAAKAQVVGWPPIRSFRKNTLASAKNNDQIEEKSAAPCLYVKVSMDGAPYLRKVDLQTYGNYKELSYALEKMFNCIITGQSGSNGHGKQDRLGESQSTDLQNAENVLTYEDKDGDWMLVGDVPWRMFTDNCRKLRIMKGSEAIGLAPNAAEKCKTEV